MINIFAVKKRYPRVQALEGIDLDIAEGQIFLLLGPNGAGKTTLIKIMLGLLFADEGQVHFSKKIRFGYMQEEKFPKTDWSVETYLRFIGELSEMKPGKIEDRVVLLLEKFALTEKRRSKIRDLSKGLRQRLKWAQALFMDPEVLVLDEPSSGLDPIGKIEMRQWIKEEYEKGKTIIISTHMLDEMEKLGSHFAILDRGRIKKQGAVADLKTEGLESFFYRVIKGKDNENHN